MESLISKFIPHKPDILACIASISSNTEHTPPEFVNQILDNLEINWAKDNNGANIWEDETVTFLNPFTKNGVFLREIVTRLSNGLENKYPTLEKRVDHILTNQIFGIATETITGMVARRSVYCSKDATGTYSVSSRFSDSDGNIKFQRIEHTWKVNEPRCIYCGAHKANWGRGKDLETYAYLITHTDDIQKSINKLFGEDMQFDVIIGNPPYQLSDGGGEGSSAIPLYHEFVSQAINLDPKYLVMIIPARWYSGGKGLNDFRKSMLSDPYIAELHDYPETELVFPGRNIRGGVCYFIRSIFHQGPSRVVNHFENGEPNVMHRYLSEPEQEIFVRYNKATAILKKVLEKGEQTFDNLVQSRNPFGIPSNHQQFKVKQTSPSDVILFRSRRGDSDNREVFIEPKYIKRNLEFKDQIKVLVSKASPGGDEYPHAIFSKPILAPKNSVSTETYLIVDFPGSKKKAKNLITYMDTRFFRFLVSLVKNTQNISKSSFQFVPVQDLSKEWTDEILYEKYGITEDEISFIESMIREAKR